VGRCDSFLVDLLSPHISNGFSTLPTWNMSRAAAAASLRVRSRLHAVALERKLASQDGCSVCEAPCAQTNQPDMNWGVTAGRTPRELERALTCRSTVMGGWR
jgi:hypothetical protein